MTKKKPAKGTDWPSRLKALRDQYGLKQREAAEKLGVALRTWQNWEYGRRVPNAAAAKLIGMLFPEE